MGRVIFLCALLAAAAICARAEDKKEEPPPTEDVSGDPEVDGKKEMAEMDANKDGKATLTEIEAFMKARYYTKPEDLKDLQNDDGKPATPEDITKMISRDASELMKELDKDKSNDLNEAEIIAQYEDTGDMPEDDEGEDAAAEEADGDAMPEEGEDEKK